MHKCKGNFQPSTTISTNQKRALYSQMTKKLPFHCTGISALLLKVKKKSPKKYIKTVYDETNHPSQLLLMRNVFFVAIERISIHCAVFTTGEDRKRVG